METGICDPTLIHSSAQHQLAPEDRRPCPDNTDRSRAPKFAGTLNRFKTPAGGILMTASVFLLGVGLEYVVPERAL
jgi:L-asparagine transporter-like permease